MKNPKNKLKIGDKVQSVYKARWHGIIIGENYGTYQKKPYTIWLIVVILTHDGRKQEKFRLKRLSERWLIPSNKDMELPDPKRYCWR